MTASRFVFVRHGESTWNASGRWQGHGDPPLSPRGREQARRLAQQLAVDAIEVIFASDLRRALETAGELGAALGIAPRTDPRLRELDVGAWTGLTRAEIAARDPGALAAFERDEPGAPAGGAECRRELAHRTRAALADIAAAHAGCSIAVVAHLGTVRALWPDCELGNAGFRRATAAELSALIPARAGLSPRTTD